MAIVKIISNGKNMAAARKIMSYILDVKKTEPDLCGTLGDVDAGILTPKSAYREFQRVRSLFGKDSGRTYTHGTVSWASDEITHEEAADFAREYLPRIYPDHQVIYAVHMDTDHIHFHFVVNPVSYLDGSMLHWSKHDLEKAKQICNEMCLQRGWQVAKKGHHHDGTAFTDGEITVWSKDKYQELIRNPKQSYLVDAILAINSGLTTACSREEFCSTMEKEYGWRVVWEDRKKHITFIDLDGHKVRGSNLSKTFNVEISKEAILRDIERNRARGQEANAAGASGKYPGTKGEDVPAGVREWDFARGSEGIACSTGGENQHHHPTEASNRKSTRGKGR